MVRASRGGIVGRRLCLWMPVAALLEVYGTLLIVAFFVNGASDAGLRLGRTIPFPCKFWPNSWAGGDIDWRNA